MGHKGGSMGDGHISSGDLDRQEFFRTSLASFLTGSTALLSQSFEVNHNTHCSFDMVATCSDFPVL